VLRAPRATFLKAIRVPGMIAVERPPPPETNRFAEARAARECGTCPQEICIIRMRYLAMGCYGSTCNIRGGALYFGPNGLVWLHSPIASEVKALLKLKRVELQGFKSFCERTELRFNGAGIAGIVGPNGAASRIYPMPLVGCWANSPPRACAAREWKT